MPVSKQIDAYFVAIVLLAVSIPLSKFGMSVAQFGLLLIWLIDGLSLSALSSIYKTHSIFVAIPKLAAYSISHVANNFLSKVKVFLRNKVALVLASLFLLHLVGLLHTTDFQYALKDLRTKLPLLLLPLIFSSMPALTQKKTNILLGFYILSVFIGSMFSLNAYLQKDFADIRQISVFISSVRFSLSVVFSFFLIVYFLRDFRKQSLWQTLVLIAVAIWFVVFIFILESAIGVVSLIVVASLIMIRQALRISHPLLKTTLILAFVGIPGFTAFYIGHVAKDLMFAEPVHISELETHSALGDFYRHDTIHFGIEDGKYIGLYMAEKELAEAWNKRSSFDFLGYDEAGQLIQYTIIRYMASKDLRKDANGVAQLTEQDIRWIEKGIANINYIKNPSLKTRISKILQGYELYTSRNDPNGSSVMQRVEYIETSLQLIRENFWTGVGTGDLPQAFRDAYEKSDSPLKEKWRWRSHNQYLSIFIAFGLFGFLWFLFTLIFPIIYQRKYLEYQYFVFITILMLSMFTEDTIESQAGVTLFAFFNAFLLLASRK